MDEKTKTQIAKRHLTNKWIIPKEIAEAVIFLAKNDSACGEILTIDAGMNLKTTD